MDRDNGPGLRELAIRLAEAWERTATNDHVDPDCQSQFDATATELSDLLGLEGAMRVRLYSDDSAAAHIMWTTIAACVFAVRLLKPDEAGQSADLPDQHTPPLEHGLDRIHRSRLAALMSGDLGPKRRATTQIVRLP